MTEPTWDLRCGDWRSALADVESVDAVICDPPYSARTHEGQSEERRDLGYAAWAPGDVHEFVSSWSPRCRGWMVALTDDVLAPVWRAAYAAAGRCDFAPLPIIQHRPRLQGDGPGSGTVWMLVSRPRAKRFIGWGSLPPWYEAPPERDAVVVGAKPLALMAAVVRDYARPGDLIVDPCAGGGTTLLAARLEGRRSIGAEICAKTYAAARKRLEAPHTPLLFSSSEAA